MLSLLVHPKNTNSIHSRRQTNTDKNRHVTPILMTKSLSTLRSKGGRGATALLSVAVARRLCGCGCSLAWALPAGTLSRPLCPPFLCGQLFVTFRNTANMMTYLNPAISPGMQ